MLTENMFLCHFILLEVAKNTLEVWPAVNISKFNIWQANAQCTGKPAFEQNYFQTRFLLLWNNKGHFINFFRICFLQLVLMEKIKSSTSLFCPPIRPVAGLGLWDFCQLELKRMRPGSHHDDILSEYIFVHSQVKTPNSGYGQNMRGAESVCFAQSGLLPGQIHSLKELFLSLPIFYVV